jgi:hypothetical protein
MVHDSLLSIIMAVTSHVLIEVPMPIRTPRLTIRPKEIGDGAITSPAVAETWEELNRWMRWAENRDAKHKPAKPWSGVDSTISTGKLAEKNPGRRLIKSDPPQTFPKSRRSVAGLAAEPLPSSC